MPVRGGGTELNMSKIFIIEDDDNIRELVLYALHSSGFECAGFESDKEFFDVIQSSMPDLLLLDIMLPGEDGIAILKALKSSGKTNGLPVIMLTAKAAEYDRVKGLDLGADDYITKPFSVLELISRIKAVLRRSELKKPQKGLIIDPVSIYPEKRSVTVNSKNIDLTYKEFELLYYLMQNEGIVLTREKIMEKIWGFDFEGETRTVDMHIKTLRQKLKGGGTIIKTIRGVGYKAGV